MKSTIIFLLVAIFFYSSSAKSLSREDSSKEVSKEDVSKELGTRNKISSTESNESRGDVHKIVSSEKYGNGEESNEDKAPREKSREKRGVKTNSSESKSSESNSNESGEKNQSSGPVVEIIEKVEATTVLVDEFML